MYLEIDEGYPGHRKTLRLCALLKCDTADAYPPRLWSWAARSAPDGDLTGMEDAELELALRWRGADGVLFAALVAAGFIDRDPDGCARIHNWGGRTGGAIEKMAARAGMAKERRAHVDGKCLQPCRYCTGTLTLRSLARSSQDKTRQDQSSDSLPLPVLSGLLPDQTPAHSESRAGIWIGRGWLNLFGPRWCEKYGGLQYGGGLDAAKATGALSEQIAELAPADALAAQVRAAAMIAEFLADDSPSTVKARHPFSWFVTRWNGLRVPATTAAKPKERESFATLDARTAREAAERTRASLHRDVAQTAETLTTCPEHLYGPREDRKCNKRCPMWEGAPIPSDPVRTLAESKGAAHG